MSLFKSKWLSVGIIAVIGWLGLSLIKVKIHENIVNKELGGLNSKIANLEENNSSLEQFVEYLKNPSFIEKEIRLKMNFKSPGESVVFVYPDKNVGSSASLDFEAQLAKMPNILKWWYYLLGY